jgi:hypothetical protein
MLLHPAAAAVTSRPPHTTAAAPAAKWQRRKHERDHRKNPRLCKLAIVLAITPARAKTVTAMAVNIAVMLGMLSIFGFQAHDIVPQLLPQRHDVGAQGFELAGGHLLVRPKILEPAR